MKCYSKMYTVFILCLFLFAGLSVFAEGNIDRALKLIAESQMEGCGDCADDLLKQGFPVLQSVFPVNKKKHFTGKSILSGKISLSENEFLLSEYNSAEKAEIAGENVSLPRVIMRVSFRMENKNDVRLKNLIELKRKSLSVANDQTEIIVRYIPSVAGSSKSFIYREESNSIIVFCRVESCE